MEPGSTISKVGHSVKVSLEAGRELRRGRRWAALRRPGAGSRPSLFPQMNMLMRLQEAANYSSPQSYDSDSNSTSHQDDILDSSLESTL